MFKKNKPQPVTNNNVSHTSPDKSEVNTLVGNTTTIEGDLRFTGVLKIDGTIKGNIVADSNDSVLILDEAGRIDGEIHVPSMIINGAINGNVYASEKIDLYPQAKIMGDVHYNLLEMEVGAEVNGRMLRQEGQTMESTPETKEVSEGDSIEGNLET